MPPDLDLTEPLDGEGGDDGDGDGAGSIREYMIVSGGFTDRDWVTFPVWAYDMDHYDRGGPEHVGGVGDGSGRGHGGGGGGPWYDLSGLGLGQADGPREPSAPANPPLFPRGRVGHLSSVRDGHLYVFGGLTYAGNDDGFEAEGGPYVWRARIDDRLPPSGGGGGRAGATGRTPLVWEKITPNVTATTRDGDASAIGDYPAARDEDRDDGEDYNYTGDDGEDVEDDDDDVDDNDTHDDDDDNDDDGQDDDAVFGDHDVGPIGQLPGALPLPRASSSPGASARAVTGPAATPSSSTAVCASPTPPPPTNGAPTRASTA